MMTNLDQEVIYSKKKMDPHFDYKEINCQECKRKLKICQIQRKRISRHLDFAILTYYCQKCKLTYYIFKFVNKNEV